MERSNRETIAALGGVPVETLPGARARRPRERTAGRVLAGSAQGSGRSSIMS